VQLLWVEKDIVLQRRIHPQVVRRLVLQVLQSQRSVELHRKGLKGRATRKLGVDPLEAAGDALCTEMLPCKSRLGLSALGEGVH